MFCSEAVLVGERAAKNSHVVCRKRHLYPFNTSPRPKMVALKPTLHHARVDITAQAQLQTQLVFPPRNLLLRLCVFPDDVAQPPGPPRQQRLELCLGGAGLDLCKVQRQAEACGAGSLEDGREEGYLSRGTGGGVAAEVQTDYRCVLSGRAGDAF